MRGRKVTVVVLVLVWAGVFAASFLVASWVEGSRNIDTGFKRLDIFVQYQLVAFALAIMSAILGFIWRKLAARVLLIGLVPLSVTALMVAGITVFATIESNRQAPQDAGAPPKPTAPVAEAPAATRDRDQ